MAINEGIKEEFVNECILCGAVGIKLYQNLRDKLFGSAGIWSLSCCPADGHIWLNPRPTIEDIAKVYLNYYTHDLENGKYSMLTSMKTKAESILLNSEYHYNIIHRDNSSGITGIFFRFLPMAKEIAGSKVMWLDAHPNGNLLDVGCGNGSFLIGMKKLGWNVTGVEPDANAAKIAMDRLGMPITVGTLEQANFPNNYFDAITAHHVIEHMHDPVGFLKESLRIIKPGGKLVVTTPNMAGWGHRVFRMFWRGLEIPRHLHIFSPHTIRICAEKAGAVIETLRTSARSTGRFGVLVI